METMSREKLLKHGSMEHEWLRRRINRQVVEDALERVEPPAKVHLP